MKETRSWLTASHWLKLLPPPPPPLFFFLVSYEGYVGTIRLALSSVRTHSEHLPQKGEKRKGGGLAAEEQSGMDE